MSEGVILQAHQKAAQAAALEAAAAFERLAGDSHDEWFVTFVHSFYEIDVDSIKNGYPALYLPALQRLKAVIDWHMIGLTQHIATPPEDTPSMANPVQSIALVGLLPTPISVLDTWPEMYKQPHSITVRRQHSARRYQWSARRERALVAAARAHRHGFTTQRRITPFEYEYLDGGDVVIRAETTTAPRRIIRKVTRATTEVIRVD